MQLIAKTTKFIQEVKAEFKKVTWPDRNELVGSTAVVIVAVFLLALFIAACDLIFSKGIRFIIR